MNCSPSPPGHDDELIELEMSVMRVSDGRVYASNRFRFTSLAKVLRSSDSWRSASKDDNVAMWLEAYEGLRARWWA